MGADRFPQQQPAAGTCATCKYFGVHQNPEGQIAGYVCQYEPPRAVAQLVVVQQDGPQSVPGGPPTKVPMPMWFTTTPLAETQPNRTCHQHVTGILRTN